MDRIETCLETLDVKPGDWLQERVFEAVWEHHQETGYIEGHTLPADWDPAEDVPQSLVADIVEDHRLVAQQQVRAHLDADADRLAEQRWRGLAARDVFDTVVRQTEAGDETTTEADIAVRSRRSTRN